MKQNKALNITEHPVSPACLSLRTHLVSSSSQEFDHEKENEPVQGHEMLQPTVSVTASTAMRETFCVVDNFFLCSIWIVCVDAAPLL